MFAQDKMNSSYLNSSRRDPNALAPLLAISFATWMSCLAWSAILCMRSPAEGHVHVFIHGPPSGRAAVVVI